MKFYSSHAEMIADYTDSKTYTNRSNSAALAGHSDDLVLIRTFNFSHIGLTLVGQAAR